MQRVKRGGKVTCAVHRVLCSAVYVVTGVVQCVYAMGLVWFFELVLLRFRFALPQESQRRHTHTYRLCVGVRVCVGNTMFKHLSTGAVGGNRRTSELLPLLHLLPLFLLLLQPQSSSHSLAWFVCSLASCAHDVA